MPNLPSKVVLKPVTWQVVSLNGTNAIFGLDSKNYENLSRNLSDITAYIEKLRYTIHSIETTNFTYTTNTINSNTNRWFKSLFN
jgi:enoyl-[acyl-carrier-protein] reductase (NADH)|tara:strand:- start:4454 stop:4705 length:252 start_codon:yes stop_codon:yes gene_type:complete